jgi:predicted nucleic acid-binding protein
LTIAVNDQILIRARELHTAGYGAFDAMHLASAEAGRADVLLTTDDRFLKCAFRGDGLPLIPVRDPVSWLREVS